MKFIVMFLLLSASMIVTGCAIPDRLKNVRTCTLGCGETIKAVELTVPPIINERPTK